MVHQKSGISLLLVDDDEGANIARRDRLVAKLGDEIDDCFIATTKQDVIRCLEDTSVSLVLSTNTVLDKTGTHQVHVNVARLIEACDPDSDTTHAYMGAVLMPLYFSLGKNRLKKRLRRLCSAVRSTKQVMPKRYRSTK
ncbi:MAG: hypothetical protein L0H36_00750 [bacterium]|nr:hypothetical protein [bacterium]